VREVVINTAWLDGQFPAPLGDGARWGLSTRYSTEGRDHGGALETAGGVRKALPWLGEVFWLVSADIFAPGFEFSAATAQHFAGSNLLAHLWLVPNPDFHVKGDFGIAADGYGLADGTGPDGRRWTYANLALCRAELCAPVALGTRAALGPLLYAGMRERRITVQPYAGEWHNLGTPQQWRALQPS
jgi:MurNAc alpha-1-phosphate uridylyltransferase